MQLFFRNNIFGEKKILVGEEESLINKMNLFKKQFNRKE